MLLVILFLLLTTALILLCLKRNREAAALFGCVASLAFYLFWILVYIAKKGGFSPEMLRLLFLSAKVRGWLQYMVILLKQLGYLIAIGRYTFPLLMLLLALSYASGLTAPQRRAISLSALALPILSLALYYPPVFARFEANVTLLNLIVSLSHAWVIAYVAAAAALLLYEITRIRVRFARRVYLRKVVLLLSMGLLYLIYSAQDPAQVYLFYRNEYMLSRGLLYLSPSFDYVWHLLVLLLTSTSSLTGLVYLVCITAGNALRTRWENNLKKHTIVARDTGNVFVHSIKNQLLTLRVYTDRMREALAEDAPDLSRIKDDVALIEQVNHTMLGRIDELYRRLKSPSVVKRPVRAEEIFQEIDRRFADAHPGCAYTSHCPPGVVVDVDFALFCEALMNLLQNSADAHRFRTDGKQTRIWLRCVVSGRNVVFEVGDDGVGLSPAQMRRVFEPFNTQKNSNHNWGMGLLYVRDVVRNHRGELHIQSKRGEGAVATITLPKDATGSVKKGGRT